MLNIPKLQDAIIKALQKHDPYSEVNSIKVWKQRKIGYGAEEEIYIEINPNEDI